MCLQVLEEESGPVIGCGNSKGELFVWDVTENQNVNEHWNKWKWFICCSCGLLILILQSDMILQWKMIKEYILICSSQVKFHLLASLLKKTMIIGLSNTSYILQTQSFPTPELMALNQQQLSINHSAELDIGPASWRIFHLYWSKHLILLPVVSFLVTEKDRRLRSFLGIVPRQLLIELIGLLLGLSLPGLLLFPQFLLIFLHLLVTLLAAQLEITGVVVLNNCITWYLLLEGLGLVVFSGSFQ